MTDIFISYAHKDREFADLLTRAFRAEGLSVWWDPTITFGKDFGKEIAKALKESAIVVTLWSTTSVESHWVLSETDEGVKRNILVPVLIEDEVEIPFEFRRLQAASLAHWTGDANDPVFVQLIATLKARLETASLSVPAVEPVKTGLAQRITTAADDTGRFIRSKIPGLGHREQKPDRRGLLDSFKAAPRSDRAKVTALVAFVFLINYIETAAEVALHRQFGLGAAWGLRIAAAFSALEGHLSFESHDLSNWVAVYGYSAAYFFLLPVLGVGLGIALWRRSDVTGYRIYCLAIAIDYFASLGFFVLFPVPERWSYPDSGAMLLSDRWSSTLIDLLRPISALDNCFPSTHVSLTVVIVLVGYVAGVRLRHTVAVLGVPIVLSTFVLGIHWLPDIIAGTAVGTLSVGVARRLCASETGSEPSATVHTFAPKTA